MDKTPFVSAGKGNMYWMILYIGAIIILPKLFGSIPGIIGAIVLIFGIYRITHKIELSKNKKILYSILVSLGGIIIALVLSLILTGAFDKLINTSSKTTENNQNTDQLQTTTATTKSDSSKEFKVYTMSNSLKVLYPADWTASQGDNEYVVNLQSKDNEKMIEVSYNVLPDGESKNVNVWKTDVIGYGKANPDLGIDQSSIEIKKIAGNNTLIFNQTGGGLYATQAIIPVESSGNNKYIQFTLKTNTANLLSSNQVILDEVITKTFLANIQ